jgi:hypothetical protein
VDYPTTTVVNTPAVFESKTNSLAGIPGVENNPNFAFKIVTEFESTAINSPNSNYVAANPGSTYSTTGTLRYDMVTVTGSDMPVAGPGLGFSGTTFSTNGFQFSLFGTNASQGVIEYSMDLSNWFSLGTNALPFTFTETNFDAPQKFYRARLAQ